MSSNSVGRGVGEEHEPNRRSGNWEGSTREFVDIPIQNVDSRRDENTGGTSDHLEISQQR